MRHGYYAGRDGAEYEASPDGDSVRLYTAQHAEGFRQIGPDRFVQVVPLSEVDRLSYVSTYCTWRGEPFLVLSEHEEWVRVEYTGGKAGVAERLALELFDRDVHQTWAPRSEIGDLREESV
ncbi:hypothetical protein AGRA3207_001616 [Actinomadura graeca]|uniref:Uncharacterized protein n=1 Tax=Actinomadura graeca TaxID=2750812 RepID=A0ABX8R6F1_9ACTN|nr:hypothetical protein AGRA3207_001616 [Actinomadura graeca]